jgi:uncharacterized protein (TIGR04255 family)
MSLTGETPMPLTLPALDDRPLARAPLAVVVFQVRFEQNLSVGDGDTGLRIHERLGGRDGLYPRVEPLQMLGASVQMGPGLAPITSPTVPSRGVRMRNDDGTLVLSLMPEFISIETTSYGSWKNDFRDRISEVLNALNDNIQPRVEERLGLRYVNRIVEPEVSSPADFRGIISDGLLGPIVDDFWSPGVTGLQQQLEIDVYDDVQCVVRHGTLARSTGIGLDGYLLDLDLFRQQPRRFDVKNIIETSDRINEAATTLFQNSLAPGYLEILREVPSS